MSVREFGFGCSRVRGCKERLEDQRKVLDRIYMEAMALRPLDSACHGACCPPPSPEAGAAPGLKHGGGAKAPRTFGKKSLETMQAIAAVPKYIRSTLCAGRIGFEARRLAHPRRSRRTEATAAMPREIDHRDTNDKELPMQNKRVIRTAYPMRCESLSEIGNLSPEAAPRRR